MSANSGTAEESKTFCGEALTDPCLLKFLSRRPVTCWRNVISDRNQVFLLSGKQARQNKRPGYQCINLPEEKLYSTQNFFVKSEDSLVNSGIGINMTGHSFLLVMTLVTLYYNKHIPAPLLGCSSIPVQKQKGNSPALKLTKLLDSVPNKPQPWNSLDPSDLPNILLSCNSDKAGRTKFNKISWSKFWERKHYFRSQCQNSVCLK